MESNSKEKRIVLGHKEFDLLVRGQDVLIEGVRIILSDIGYSEMKKVVEDAEINNFSNFSPPGGL